MTLSAGGAARRTTPADGDGPGGQCSATSLALREPAAGTAPHVSTWLLVEQPGPWGRKAVTDSRLDPEVAAELERRADVRDTLRVQLIRRPDGTAGSPRRAFVCRPAKGRLLEVVFADEATLLDLDLDTSALEGVVPNAWAGGHHRLRAAPLYLVCTNGRRDRCCATLGRDLVAALAERFGEAVWETSHVGGHRFAANLVCLPDGTYYGRLDAASGPAAVAGHRDGHLDLDHLRGRSWLPPAAQAAEAFVRRRRGLFRFDDVRVEAVRTAAGGEGVADAEGWVVTLVAAGRPSRVLVERRTTGRARPVSCGADPEDPGELVCTLEPAGG